MSAADIDRSDGMDRTLVDSDIVYADQYACDRWKVQDNWTLTDGFWEICIWHGGECALWRGDRLRKSFHTVQAAKDWIAMKERWLDGRKEIIEAVGIDAWKEHYERLYELIESV